MVERHWWRLVGAIWGLGLALRLAFVTLVTRHDEPLGDQINYSAQALANAKGHWFEQPFDFGMPAAEHPPFTSLALTPVTWLTESTGRFVAAQRYTIAILGSLAIIVVALLARRLAGPVAGVVAAGITALYANVWVSDGLIMSEPFAFTFTALLLLALVAYRSTPSLALALAMGALAGLAALSRAELLVLGAAGALVPLLTRWRGEGGPRIALRDAAVAVVATGVLVGPWVLWNQARFEGPVTLSTNDGITLAGANCDSVYYGYDLGGWDIWCALDVPRPEGLDAAQESEIMRRAGMDYWREHLDRYPVVAVARVSRLFSVWWLPQTVTSGENAGRPPAVSWLGIVQWWGLVALAVVGWRRVRPGVERWALVALLPFMVVIALTAHANPRLRVPAEVGVIVLASAGAAHLAARWSRRRSQASEPAPAQTSAGLE